MDVLVSWRPDYGPCGKAGLTTAASRRYGAQKKALWTQPERLQGFQTWKTIV